MSNAIIMMTTLTIIFIILPTITDSWRQLVETILLLMEKVRSNPVWSPRTVGVREILFTGEPRRTYNFVPDVKPVISMCWLAIFLNKIDFFI